MKAAVASMSCAAFVLAACAGERASTTRDSTTPDKDRGWKIAFVRNVYEGADAPNADIYVIDGDGSGQTRLTDNDADDQNPAWSPDGTKIAFTRYAADKHEIYVMNADGSGERRLTVKGVANSAPVWSPDGSRIAFASQRRRAWNVYVIHGDGQNETRLTNTRSPGVAFAGDGNPAWSPDGTKIVFESNRDDPLGETVWLFVMNADGSEERRLSARDGHWPVWSPDGTRIAFASYDDGDFQIYTVNVDGSGESRVTRSGAADSEPAWSPDGSKIAFISDSREAIYVINSDGTGERKLIPVPFVASGVTWSPDGSTVIFSRCFLEGDDACEIAAIGADGRHFELLVEKELHAYSPAVSSYP